MEKLQIGHPAPVFRLASLDGQATGLEDLHGQVVIVNFWSAECPYSAKADLELRALESRPDWQGRVVLLTIASNAGEPVEMVAASAQASGLKCVLLDPDQRVADLYCAQTTPHVFVIDPDGLLRYQGALNDFTFRKREPTRFYAREALEALLDGNPVILEETAPYGCTIVRSQ